MEAYEMCKLCLKQSTKSNMLIIDENLVHKLKFLHLDLDQICEETCVCKECKQKIEDVFIFKSCLITNKSKAHFKDKEYKDQVFYPSTSNPKVECHLCQKLVNATSVIRLSKILKDEFIMELFQEYIPEMNSENIENMMVCDTCEKSLFNFSILVSSWTNAYSCKLEIKEDLDIGEQFKVENIKTEENPSLDSLRIEENNEDQQDAGNESIQLKNKEIEDQQDAGNESIQLKNEEIEIKDEDGTRNYVMNSETSEIACELCTYRTKCKYSMRKHRLFHNNPKELKCHLCSYQAKWKRNLNEHHKSKHMIKRKPRGLKTTKFKCYHCDFVTSLGPHLFRHISLIHKMDICENYKFQILPTNASDNQDEFIDEQTEDDKKIKKHLYDHNYSL